MTNQLVPSSVPDYESDLLKREAADVHLRGLAVVSYQPRSWQCSLNYFPNVVQQCRHDNWEIGPDGRVRPRRGTVASGYFYIPANGEPPQPRVKIRNLPKDTKPPTGAATMPPPPPPPDQSIVSILARVEAKLDRLLGVVAPTTVTE